MKNEEMKINAKVYFWTSGAETPTLRSGRVIGGYKEESTIYGYVFQIEANGVQYFRHAWNCYASVEDVKASIDELLIEGASDD